MPNEVIQFLNGFNMQTIISMWLLMWYFNRDIKASIDKLDEDVREMNSRLCRLEGTVYGEEVYNHIQGD